VSASPLGKLIADQCDTEVDRCGRVVVEPDLTIKGHPNVFVVGDMAAVPDVPGVAQGAIQGAKYATNIIKRDLKGQDDPVAREPFKYWDKGSMATISRHHAVAKVGKLEFGGYIAWLAWLFLHLLYLVGFKNRLSTLFSWILTFTSHSRSQLTTTWRSRCTRRFRAPNSWPTNSNWRSRLKHWSRLPRFARRVSHHGCMPAESFPAPAAPSTGSPSWACWSTAWC
jgi:hypothetical protein